MNTWKIGLEVHININDPYKLWYPGSGVNEFDKGAPGTIPSFLNWRIIRKATKLADLLNMKRTKFLIFDRKIYKYPDIPSGYQITQKTQPAYIDGFMQFENKKIVIKSMHIENDAGRIWQNKVLLNRINKGLVELVTAPVFTNYRDIEMFIKTLQILVKVHGISNGKMENGDIRMDINFSCENSGRFEVKNINSISNIKNIISWIPNFINNKKDQTLKYTDNGLEFMREKEEYLYVRESNIPIYRMLRFNKEPLLMTYTDYYNIFEEISHILDADLGPLIMKHYFKYGTIILHIAKINIKILYINNLSELLDDLNKKNLTMGELKKINTNTYQRTETVISETELVDYMIKTQTYQNAMQGDIKAQKALIGMLAKQFPEYPKYHIITFLSTYFSND